MQTIEKLLPKFDCGYWSLYDIKGKITSPFYHNLHIAQMKALYMISGNETFNFYAQKFTAYQRSLIKPKIAFIKKAFQKISD